MVELTLGQIFQRALLNTLLGMGTVFAVLIFISLLISLFAYIPKLQQRFGKKQETDGQSAEPGRPRGVQANVSATRFGGFKFRAKTTEPAKAEEKDYIDDRELVAVITAAIAAYQGTSTDGLIVRSIKRAKKQNW